MKYTIPKLIDLEKEGEGPDWQEVSGACIGGSAAGSCMSGSIPADSCSTGTGIGGDCLVGAFVKP